MASFTLHVPSSTQRPETTTGSHLKTGWRTILFNCDCHSFHEVAAQLVRAIHCDYQRGLALANVVHLTGSATVFWGPRESCEVVAETLGMIGLRVSVSE
ncbi:MAG: ATP-dependent Clp protease adaptor ClpS [Elusimicrobia bacterium]|nr:ATP-dependent Clp protease adaptor ClpS [Elusimicrobiota bacterium]